MYAKKKKRTSIGAPPRAERAERRIAALCFSLGHDYDTNVMDKTRLAAVWVRAYKQQLDVAPQYGIMSCEDKCPGSLLMNESADNQFSHTYTSKHRKKKRKSAVPPDFRFWALLAAFVVALSWSTPLDRVVSARVMCIQLL